jgi:hypothetical protein
MGGMMSEFWIGFSGFYGSRAFGEGCAFLLVVIVLAIGLFSSICAFVDYTMRKSK